MVRINTKLIFPSCIFLISIIYLFTAKGLALGVMKRPGVGFMPVIAGTLLALFSLVEIINSFLDTKSGSKVELEWKKVGIFILGVAIYILALKYIGYTISTFALILFLTKLFGVKSWIKPVVFSALLAYGTYYLFVEVLMVQLI